MRELPAEADAEERDPAIDRLPDQVGGLLDERLFVGVPDVERGAEDDDARDVVERRSWGRVVEAFQTRTVLPAASTAPGATPNVSEASQRTKRITGIGPSVAARVPARPHGLWHTSGQWIERRAAGGADDGQGDAAEAGDRSRRGCR